MCTIRRSQYRCGHSGPSIATRPCRLGFDYRSGRCYGGRDRTSRSTRSGSDSDSDLVLQNESCSGCRARDLGLVQPAGWQPLPLRPGEREPLPPCRDNLHDERSWRERERDRSHSASAGSSSSPTGSISDSSNSSSNGSKTQRFVQYLTGDEPENSGYVLGRSSRRGPKTTGWRYAEQARIDQEAREAGSRQRKTARERAKGEERLLATLRPSDALLRTVSAESSGTSKSNSSNSSGIAYPDHREDYLGRSTRDYRDRHVYGSNSSDDRRVAYQSRHAYASGYSSHYGSSRDDDSGSRYMYASSSRYASSRDDDSGSRYMYASSSRYASSQRSGHQSRFAAISSSTLSGYSSHYGSSYRSYDIDDGCTSGSRCGRSSGRDRYGSQDEYSSRDKYKYGNFF